MKVIIAGGTGFIGTYLKKRFEQDGDSVLIISRGSGNVQWKADQIESALEDADVLVNLAGRNINCRYNEKNKKQILESRISSTTLLGETLKKVSHGPKLWINASASAIYSPQNKYAAVENSLDLGFGFLAQVVKIWESTFFGFQLPRVRQAVLRTSVVLGKSGGAFHTLSLLTKYGLGGQVGSGKQMFSWIHVEDYYRIVRFLIENENLSGVINCTSPGAVTNKDLMKSLRHEMKIPLGIPAPAFAVKLGARIIGTEPELLLDSSWLYPEVLLNNGFEFQYPDITGAAKNLLQKIEK